MTTILITNAYSARNKGDAGIVAGMIESLRRQKVFADAEISISSAAGPAEAGFPEPVIHSFTSLKNGLSNTPRLQQLGFLFLVYPLTLLWIAGRRIFGLDLPVWAPLRRLLRAYDAADLVVAAGGGYLYTRSAVRGTVILLSVIYGYHCAALLGKPVYLFSQSIGPFAGRFQQWLVRRSLCGVRMVFAREDDTLRRLEQLAAGRNMPEVHSAVDAAFLLDTAAPQGDLPPPPPGGIRVGLTVRDWFTFPPEQQRYETMMAGFAGWLTEEMGAAVFLVPQVTFHGGGDDDRIPARRVKALAGNNPQLHLIEDELDPAGIRGLCGAMDLFVGTRMHSNIFALSMTVPVLAVGYQPKTRGIMSRLGLENFVLPIEGLDLPVMKEQFRHLLAEREAIAAGLARDLPRLRKEACRPGRIIAEDFGG